METSKNIFPSATLAVAPAPATVPLNSGLSRLSFRALGSTCEVLYDAPLGTAQGKNFEQAAVAWINAFEAKYSRYIPTSLVSHINAASGFSWIAVDEETDRIFELCDRLFSNTQGIIDPTAFPLMKLWDWKTRLPTLPKPAEIDAARKLVGWTKVRRSFGRIFLPIPGMTIDLSGFSREYAVDTVAQIAVDHGIANVLVDFGRAIRALGTPPGWPKWRISSKDSGNPGKASGHLAFSGNCAVVSLGDQIRSVKIGNRRYGHIIDPRTGWPVANGCLQSTIVAKTCLEAVMLSTTSFIQGVPRGLEFIRSYPDAEGQLITETTHAQTRGFYRYAAE